MFKGFPYVSLCKTCWPLGGDIFGHNLNNFGRGPLDEATYQISKTWTFWFQSRRFLKVFPMLVYVENVGPWVGPFLAPGL